MGVALAATVAGRRHAHEAGVLAVLHVAGEDDVLDQQSLARMVASVLERTMFIFAEPTAPAESTGPWSSAITFSGAFSGWKR
jgi:hypothetical protein